MIMVPFKNLDLSQVSQETMEIIYEKIKTPVKHGAVIKWENDWTDSPTIFKKDDKYYMYFIAISKNYEVSGYETHLAESSDLLNWKYVGPIFRRNEFNRWDSKQCAGYTVFYDIDYDGSCELQKVDGHYYISYLAGNSDGYEPDPLYMGMARTDDPTDADGFIRFDNPILKPEDDDTREKEDKTLYKSCMFEDVLNVTGYPYVNIYNAKAQDNTERIYLAVSKDGENWERYGDKAVLDMSIIDPLTVIAGDPQIIRIDDVYVMLFFHFTSGKGAYDTFACSHDLINWTVWNGEPLIKPTEEWENIHAHKPRFVRHNGTNYHFYCASNDKNERFIAVATSE